MALEHKENKEPLITYRAVELSTGKIIFEGDDFDEVIEIAESSGLEFSLNFIPNPKVSFVF